MPRFGDEVIYTGEFFYTLALIGQIIILSYALVKKTDKPLAPQSLFGYAACVFIIFRIAYIAVMNDGGITAFWMNRICLCLFLTALSITLYTWMAALGIVMVADKGLVDGVRSMLDAMVWVFVVANVVMWIVEIITCAVYHSQNPATSAGNPWYEASILLIAIVCLLMGVLFLVYGWRLWAYSANCTPHVQAVLLRAGICSVVVSVFFALRVALLLYRPISNKFLPNDAFMISTYYLPELVPLFISLVVHAFRVTNTNMPGYGEREGKGEDRRKSRGYTTVGAATTPRTAAYESVRQGYHHNDEDSDLPADAYSRQENQPLRSDNP